MAATFQCRRDDDAIARDDALLLVRAVRFDIPTPAEGPVDELVRTALRLGFAWFSQRTLAAFGEAALDQRPRNTVK